MQLSDWLYAYIQLKHICVTEFSENLKFTF